MRKTLSASFILAAFLFFFVSSSHAEIKAETYSIMPFIGGYTFEGNEDLESKAVYGIRFGYDITKEWGVEGTFDWLRTNYSTNIANSDVDTYGYRLEALYHFLPQGKLVPFLAAGVGDRTAHYTNPSITRDRNQILAVYGAGLKYFLYKDIALRGDIRHMILLNDNYNNLEYTIGLAYYFGGPKPAPLDSDKDGVTDNYDKCPGTPTGVRVDRVGCPLDTDRDGVPDYLDKCPGTPAGVKVDKVGCPLDTDKDVVPDYLDKCPGTPADVKVDKDGCPPDTDKDGVPDYLDKCPDTPIGVKVDQDGCAPTAQIVLLPEPDGKVSRIEVRTSAGSQMLDKPWESTEVLSPDLIPSKPKVMDEKEVRAIFKDALAAQPPPPAVFMMYFKSGSKELTDKSLPLITEILEAIKSQGSNHVRVIGHTDTIASVKYNRRLSLLRAKSVADVLVSRGVDRGIIEIEFYGKEKLLIKTPDGVAEPRNRRVEIIVK